MARTTRHPGPERNGEPHRDGSRGKTGRTAGSQSRTVMVSKKLSWVLRHGAQKEGLNMDDGGWINVAELLRWHSLRSMKVSFAELAAVVAENDKQRFELSPIPSTEGGATIEPKNPEGFRIRASQGHSLVIDSSSLLTPVNLTDEDFPNEVVHGTNAAAWKLILSSGGLRRMTRTHIHFAVDLPGATAGRALPLQNDDLNPPPTEAEAEKPMAESSEPSSATREATIDMELARQEIKASISTTGKVISGMRTNATILIWVDVRKSIVEGGLRWWRSANGVLLTEGNEEGMVKMAFVSRVVGRSDGRILWRPDAASSLETTSSKA